jgi:hypothetical protein
MPHPDHDWRVAGVSVRGVSHQRGGQPCQDAHRCQPLGEGVLVAAVADGAGSAPLAEVGAECAVNDAAAAAVEAYWAEPPHDDEGWRQLLRQAFEAAREAVAAEAEKRRRPPGDLATTLLLAVATPDLVAAGQVGDGAVVARLAGDRLVAVLRPPEQEYVNETTFLTSAAALDSARFVVLREATTGLALFSDGLQRLALRMPQGEPHGPFFAPLLQAVAEVKDRNRAEVLLGGFLQSPRVAERADDDLTLVLAVR